MALTFLGRQNKPTYMALSTDIVDNAIPGAGMIGKTVYLTDTSAWKIILSDLTLDDYSESTSNADLNHPYYQYKASLLEPDAIESLLGGTFTYAIGANETKMVVASWNTRLGAAGRMEIRNQRTPLLLRGVTLTGLQSGSCAAIINPALPEYLNAYETYYDRLLQIAETTPKYLGIPAATTIPFLTGAYGAIVLHTTQYNSAWVSIRTNGDLYGWGLTDEINDSTQYRTTENFHFAMNKKVASEFRNEAGSDLGDPRGASLLYFLCPSDWSVIPDTTTYIFRDDFMGASLNTAATWTRAQSTVGNVEIDTLYQWLKVKGNGSWNANGAYTQGTHARVAGKKLILDVFTNRGGATVNGLLVGWNDGTGHDWTDFVHGLWFGGNGSTRILKIFENGTDKGEVGSGYTDGTIYRVEITLQATGAIYKIQGGAYGALGSNSWTTITPASSTPTTTPLRVGVSNSLSGSLYVSDAKVI